jgi:D-inositol-3-phosphate glycosyltransferase
MRIAMLSYHTCPLATLGGKDTGGMNVYVHELTRELGRSGIGVDVFTRSQDEHVPHVLHDLGYGNRVVHIPAGPESPLAKVGLEEYLGEFSQGVADFTASKQLKYDLIHSHYWLSGLSGLWLRQRWGTPVIHMFHTLALMKNRVARSPAEVASAGRLDGEQRMLREADRIVAATPAEFAQIQWLYHGDTDKVVIIPPGVDTTHFYPIMKDEAREFVGIEAEKRILLYVGRIEPLKGLDTLLEAMASLRAKRVLKDDCACLAIIGGDPDGEGTDQEMQRLQSLQESLGLRQMITFLGKRDQATLQYYYSAAEAVIVPSHYESFGLVALEAMACGTPVVASETGGLAYLVKDGETGFHVPAGDAAALAERLQMLLQDGELGRRLGRQAAEHARQYAWPLITRRIIDLYQAVLES